MGYTGGCICPKPAKVDLPCAQSTLRFACTPMLKRGRVATFALRVRSAASAEQGSLTRTPSHPSSTHLPSVVMGPRAAGGLAGDGHGEDNVLRGPRLFSGSQWERGLRLFPSLTKPWPRGAVAGSTLQASGGRGRGGTAKQRRWSRLHLLAQL